MHSRDLILAAMLGATLLIMGDLSAAANVLITVNKASQRLTVAVDGQPLYHWPVSTGRAGYITPSGTFRAFRMELDHYSKQWDDAPMPHSIFFTKIGHAIHGSYDTRRLGTPASHGCVRLAPRHAAELYALVEREGVLNTTVVLTGETPTNAPAVARRTPPPVDADGEGAAKQRPWYAPPPGQQPGYYQPEYQPPDLRPPRYGEEYRRPQFPQGSFPFHLN